MQTKRLADMARTKTRAWRMSKQFLMENPGAFRPRGLGLKASLFDGNPANMEIAERGVNLLNDNEIPVHYQTPWGPRSQSYSLTKSLNDRFFVTLREKNLQVALSDVNQRAKDSVGGIKNLPSAIVKAEREQRAGQSESREDTTFTLVREVGGTGGDYQKVLDSQLLTDNERDPGSKYKLPPVQGSISARSLQHDGRSADRTRGSQLAIGGDNRSPFAGVQLPIPLLEGFIPVDFMIQGRPGGVSLFPENPHWRGHRQRSRALPLTSRESRFVQERNRTRLRFHSRGPGDLGNFDAPAVGKRTFNSAAQQRAGLILAVAHLRQAQ